MLWYPTFGNIHEKFQTSLFHGTGYSAVIYVPLESIGSLVLTFAARFTIAQMLRQSQTEVSLFKRYSLINLATIIPKTSTSTLATAQFQSAVFFCLSGSSCNRKLVSSLQNVFKKQNSN